MEKLEMTEGTISSQLHSCRELTIMCAKQMWVSGGTCQMATTQHRCMTSAMQDKPNSASTMATTIRWCLVPTNCFQRKFRQKILYLKGTPGKTNCWLHKLPAVLGPMAQAQRDSCAGVQYLLSSSAGSSFCEFLFGTYFFHYFSFPPASL